MKLNAYEKRKLVAQQKRRERDRQRAEAQLLEQLRELKEPGPEVTTIICECIPHASYA